jgi:diguanylate cyclase (GGDEF)-like protein
VDACEFYDSQGEKFHVTVSLGVATLRERAEAKALVKHADDVLQLAKKQGKNRVIVNRRKIIE